MRTRNTPEGTPRAKTRKSENAKEGDIDATTGRAAVPELRDVAGVRRGRRRNGGGRRQERRVLLALLPGERLHHAGPDRRADGGAGAREVDADGPAAAGARGGDARHPGVAAVEGGGRVVQERVS